jgi:hypothetical protein
VNTILGFKRRRYLKRVGVFLIAIALIVGMVSCDGSCGGGGGGGVGPYTLLMAANPVAGGTATDLTGGSPYAANTSVNIQASANPGYQFVNWSAPAGTFGNATAAQTNFTMPAQNVTVTANFVRVYNLTMAVAPPGSGTATDLTNSSPYTAGTPVSIQAVANPAYRFVNWTAPAGTFANATAATTTFTMPAMDVTVTANFALTPTALLDHFKGYWAYDAMGLSINETVYLEDQFGAFNATVGAVWGFANPAEKQHEGNVTPMCNPDHHFTVYYITYDEMPQEREVEVLNQFGLQNLTVYGPIALAVPTTKEEHEAPVGLDHYLLYEVDNPQYQGVAINLTDQFGGEPEFIVTETAFFANPVQKTYKGNVTEIVNPDVHAVGYWITGASFGTQIQVDNQFGNQTLDVSDPAFLVVPSEKLAPPVPPLDHFKCYEVADALPLVDVYVELTDQFTWYDAQVLEADWFCNPVQKNSEEIVNDDNHLTVYNITPDYQDYWYVEVFNQFGYQQMEVYGPVALAAPTWKWYPGEHGEPEYLDHYLLYEVVYGTPLDEVYVNLDDEFPGTAPMVKVTEPRYFANPVAKYNYDTGTYTGVWDPKAHLLFYDISGNPEFWSWVEVEDQFDYQSLNLTPIELLAVPSQKLYYEYLGMP